MMQVDKEIDALFQQLFRSQETKSDCLALLHIDLPSAIFLGAMKSKQLLAPGRLVDLAHGCIYVADQAALQDLDTSVFQRNDSKMEAVAD